jgi:hypothetical protein
MPTVRQEYNCRRSSEVAASAISITTYDLVGRFTTDGKVTTTGAGEQPLFIFAESAATGDAVSVIWRAVGGRYALRLAGSGHKGDKLKSDTDGTIISSGTAETAVFAATDFGIALEDWTAGQSTEVEIIGGSK